MRRRNFTGSILVTSSPLILIVPEVGSFMRLIIRIVVVFPEPEVPMKQMNSPRSTEILKSDTATLSPYTLRRWEISRNAVSATSFRDFVKNSIFYVTGISENMQICRELCNPWRPFHPPSCNPQRQLSLSAVSLPLLYQKTRCLSWFTYQTARYLCTPNNAVWAIGE